MRRERGLKQLPDGRWQFSWKHEGRYHRRIAGTKTEARSCLEKIRTQIREGRYLDRRSEVKITFEQGVKKFLEWSEVNTRPNTYLNDTYYAKRWRAFNQFTGKPLASIKPADVEAYKAARIKEKKGAGTVSQKTADNDLARLKRMFSLCKTWGLCDKNPVKEVKFFKPESRRDRFLTPEEEAVLMEKADPQILAAIAFSINTGFRLGEMLSLTWAQVDMRRREVTVTAEKAKGRRSRRIPLNTTAYEALETLPRAISPQTLVFPQFDGHINRTFRNAWDQARIAANLQDACWHTLRHTFASRLVMAGVDLVTVQKLLGHTTLAMVLKYAHLAESHVKDAVAILDSKLRFSCNPSQPAVAAVAVPNPVSPLD